MDTFLLNDGYMIPSLGIGTFTFSQEEAENSVLLALKDGYRLIDTANAYLNEEGVGKGIKESGVKREDIYLSTKLWPTEYKNAKQAIDETLARLGVSYIDLLFLHQPVGDYLGAYKAMEEAKKEGKVRSLGLSNFEGKPLQEVLAHAEIKPSVLQVEAHPYYPQDDLKKELAPLGIRLMAWYPLGHGDKSLLNEKVILDLAEKYQKSPAQVILRWHTQVGNIVIPGSRNEAHIKANADIFDFSLTPEEMELVAGLNKNKRCYYSDPIKLHSYLHMKLGFPSEK